MLTTEWLEVSSASIRSHAAIEASKRIPQLLVRSHQLGILPTSGLVTTWWPWRFDHVFVAKIS